MAGSSTTVGCELKLSGDKWLLSGDPYILYRAEKAIPFCKVEKDGARTWPATEEIAVELLWFCQRFKSIHTKYELVLRSAAAKFNLGRIAADKVMRGEYDPGQIQFRDGYAPRDYQAQNAMLWRSVGGLLCADSLGTGKTLSGLAGIASPEMLPAVIVAPSALCLQWKQQIELFLPGLSSHIIKQQRNYDLQIVATCEQCGEAATAQSVATRRCKYCKATRFKRSHADIYLLSYNLADHWKIEISRVIKSVIYEEAHELRLSSSAKYTACKHIANNARFRLGLTGSPVMNWGGEMYNIINLLCPGKLGTKSQFQETWCGASEGAGKEPPLKQPEAFAQYLKNQHMMTRRTREDVGRYIPEEQQILHNIDFDQEVFRRMTKDAKELAQAIVRMSEGELARPDNLSASRFNQMVYQATGVAKAPFVANFAEMILESGEPIILFGYHLSVYEIWCRMLGRFNPLMFTGSETRNQKEHNKQQFMAGKSKLLICSIMSGVGIDGFQHHCNIGVFGELAWSPASIQQARGRYHRDGQKKSCLTYILTSEVGIDPYMLQTLGVKRLQVDGVVQAKATSNVLDSVDTMTHLRELAKKFLAA